MICTRQRSVKGRRSGGELDAGADRLLGIHGNHVQIQIGGEFTQPVDKATTRIPGELPLATPYHYLAEVMLTGVIQQGLRLVLGCQGGGFRPQLTGQFQGLQYAPTLGFRQAEHPGAAGDRAEVASRLADHRGGFAGNGALVHRGDSHHHVAITGDDLACRDLDQIPLAQLVGIDPLCAGAILRLAQLVGPYRLLQTAQAGGLGLAPPFGQRLGEVGEEQGKPEPEAEADHKPEGFRWLWRRGQPLAQADQGGDDAAQPDYKHHRVTPLAARIQLEDCIAAGLTAEPGIQQG